MRPIDIDRLKEILGTLTRFSTGEFDNRIARTEEDDLIESIIMALNMMAEEMRATLGLYADLHLRSESLAYTQMVFVLDQNFRILSVSPDVMTELGYEKKDLIKKSFSSLLAKSTMGLWRSIGSNITKLEAYSEQHKLILLAKNKSERYCDCLITSIYSVDNPTHQIIVSIYEPVVKSRLMEDAPDYETKSNSDKSKPKKPPNVLTRPKDRRVLQTIHEYILKNLEKPLPHLDQLAHMFGTNEFKLKYGFKQMYGTTVFRFLKSERMRKGKLLLENTSLPVKTVAEMCGYGNPSHFGKDFREEFGVTPREVR